MRYFLRKHPQWQRTAGAKYQLCYVRERSQNVHVVVTLRSLSDAIKMLAVYNAAEVAYIEPRLKL